MMNSLEALKTIYINCKDLLVDENYNVVKLEDLIKTIKQDLELFEKCKNENCDYQIKNAELQEENEELKQVLDILKEYRHILKYNGIEGAMELGWLKTKQYDLLKKYLGKEQDNE